MNTLGSTNLTAQYDSFQKILESLKELTSAIEHEKYSELVQEIEFYMTSPFMFVIVGEVKAGKSSFINALLKAERDICPVAPSPMTDSIQQIIYGEEESMEVINPYLKRMTFPEPSLREISIIDTPGTNTIIEHHQEITERFIPHSDLIIFVFEAKNPYRQSAWLFFDFIRDEWRKNVIFILQQKDLLGKEDLDINIQGVRDLAIKKGIEDPVIFAVSALEEKNKNPDSGYQSLRQHIDNKILSENTALLKINNNIKTVHQIIEKINQSFQIRKKQYEVDLQFREDIANTLDSQEEKTGRQIERLSESLVQTYHEITGKKIEILYQRLSFWQVLKSSFSALTGGGKSLKDMLMDEAKDLELSLHTSLKQKLESGITDVAEDIQTMGRLVQEKIKSRKNILEKGDEIFADIAERRSHILADLQRDFKDFIESADNFYDESMVKTSGSLTPDLAAGGGIAVVGIVLSAVLNGAVFDITGGILTTIGILFAGVSLGWKRNKVMKQFKIEINKGGKRINEEVNAKLKAYTQRIKERIDHHFFHLDSMLEKEKKEIERLDLLIDQIRNKLNILADNLNR